MIRTVSQFIEKWSRNAGDRSAAVGACVRHPVHAEFETRAPIIRQLIREMTGKPYLFAVYGRTPLVRFPLAALKNGAHVRGEVIGELGYLRHVLTHIAD
jgi:hypothetical protein